MASVAGLAFVEPKALLWRPAPVSLALPALRPEALVGLQQITKETLRRIVHDLQLDNAIPTLNASKIGERDMGLVAAHQYSMEFRAPAEVGEFGIDPERYLSAAAAGMSARLKQHKLTGCGQLTMGHVGNYEMCRVTDHHSGLSLRGIHAVRDYVPVLNEQTDEIDYDFTPHHVIRFDMLVAA